MVLNAIFNNISVTSISWRSVLLVEESGVPGENHRLAASHSHQQNEQSPHLMEQNNKTTAYEVGNPGPGL